MTFPSDRKPSFAAKPRKRPMAPVLSLADARAARGLPPVVEPRGVSYYPVAVRFDRDGQARMVRGERAGGASVVRFESGKARATVSTAAPRSQTP